MRGQINIRASAAAAALALSHAQVAIPQQEDTIPGNNNHIHRRGKFKQNKRKSKKG